MPAASPSRGLALVATLKLIQGALLVLVALGAFRLLHRDVGRALEGWVRALHLDPGNRPLAGLLAQAGLVGDRQLKQLGGLTLGYAALFFVEGVGLWRHQRWAEYLTVIATASLIPFELYEMVRHPTGVKAMVLVGNAAIVLYLIVVLRKKETTPAA